MFFFFFELRFSLIHIIHVFIIIYILIKVSSPSRSDSFLPSSVKKSKVYNFSSRSGHIFFVFSSLLSLSSILFVCLLPFLWWWMGVSFRLLLLHFSHCFVCLLPYFLVTIIIAFFSFFFVFFCSLCFDSFHLFFLHKFCVLFFHLPELGLGVVIYFWFLVCCYFLLCFVLVLEPFLPNGENHTARVVFKSSINY